MNILAIDTSNQTLAVAVIKDNEVLYSNSKIVNNSHSVEAMPEIEKAINGSGLTIQDIDRIAVAKGPGSYTGLRIGVTLAKTLAWTLNKELVSISSLEALALNCKSHTGLVSPIFDGRRGQVYTALFRAENGKLTRVLEDQILVNTEWVQVLSEYEEPVTFVGLDIPVHKEVFKDFQFADESAWTPNASEIALVADELEVENVHTFVPNYVRLAEAEKEWLEKNASK